MKEFTKDESKILKGITILFMLGLHLFNNIDTTKYYHPLLYIGNMPVIYYISFSFDICVPIYCFCSGYALYLKNPSMKENINRIFKLLGKYWIILIFTCITGVILNDKNIPGSIFDFLGNVTLLNLSYIGSWWFLQTYVLLVIISSWIIKAIDRLRLTVGISLILYFISYYFKITNPIQTNIIIIDILINAVELLGTSQFPFLVGMIFYKYKIITKIKNKVEKNNFIACIIILICILIHVVIKNMIIAPFIAILFVCGYALLSFNAITKKLLLFLGNHSTNIWLLHTQFYAKFAPMIVFCTNTVLGCLIILLGLCIATSHVINFLYSKTLKILNYYN
ncbi:acyltransferase family protein [Thomasclavelia spiroformis]|uniref:acyltransferase family protein n=1 Tax=Thomasclavelia spiroformis TaxID=29348 RepID=UPI00265ED4C8|nr:acyltransferase family protein [Thomasclavelia spiroformis]